MKAPDGVLKLVERFDLHLNEYQSPHYNETQVRRDFIDPFFKCLGWDVDNSEGLSEAYREVIHEDRLYIEGAPKAPDYCFLVGGERKFFTEAKKPSVNLKDDPKPAFQLRRYAWSAKLPVSILTDFEEFVIYDCRVMPNRTDKADNCQLHYISYNEYPDRWGEIHSLFSREAVLAGSLDKYAETLETHKGTATVDDAFLLEISNWREMLARNIALSNPELNQRMLNIAVQLTIDRLIFLRICEDRGIENYERLLRLSNGNNLYENLCGFYREADDRYNSGLFHFQEERGRLEPPDEFTLKLKVDDEPLKKIITNLYYPDSPYAFSVIPVDILGQVYEQFLGKVISISTGHGIAIEKKPEVRKAGGVYYTPTYIVDDIVDRTVGKFLEGKTPKQVNKLKIIDPACGSGSFLIGAYRYLLDWHLKKYIEDGVGKHKKELFEAATNDYRLTTSEKKRILLNNIYGVDIDTQAVEVTKLSLLLKVLEGENKETLNKQLKLFHDRALPDLSNNIKCGNTLIGTEFYDAKLSLFNLTEDVQYRVNVFDWKGKDGFPQIMKEGGFDVVIGNPPYIRIQTMKEYAPLEVEHYKQHYLSASQGNYDIYVVFVEKCLQLLNEKGRLGFILPHKFFNAKYGKPIRKLIADGKHLAGIVHFGHQQVFKNATTYTCLMFLDKTSQKQALMARVDDLLEWRISKTALKRSIPTEEITAMEWNFQVDKGAQLFEKLSRISVKLGGVARIFQGLVTGADKVFLLEKVADLDQESVRVKDRDGIEWILEKSILRHFINDFTVSSYETPISSHSIIFPYQFNPLGKLKLIPSSQMETNYPNTWKYFLHHKKTLCDRENGKWYNDKWYSFGRTQNLGQMEYPKLIVQVISLAGRYAYDEQGIYFTGGGNGPYYGVRWSDPSNAHSLYYLQALLSSSLLDFYLHRISTTFRGGYWSYGKRFIEQLPIRLIDFSDSKDKAYYDRIILLVEQICSSHDRYAIVKTQQEKTMIQRQIDAMKKQIDKLVSELYGLTDEETKIIERS